MNPIALEDLHYVDYSSTAAEPLVILAEVVRHVHAYNRVHDCSLGIDFPEWEPGAKVVRVGIMRVFGAKDALLQFAAQPRSLRLLALGEVARGTIVASPASDKFASILRDSNADKVKPAHARRRERRGVGPFDASHARSDLAIPLTSSTNGQSFLLKLKKQRTEADSRIVFNSYGLCIQGALPQF
jgi:CRISPR-associated endoribonuclease Cas6/Csy4 subtype I-F